MKIKQETEINSMQLQTIAQEILKEAKQQGADQAEVTMHANKGFSVTAHDGDVETIEYNQDKLIDITVYFGKRSGSAGISDIRTKAIKDAVEAATHIAKFTDEDPASGLADKEELAFNYPQLTLAYPWSISVEKAISLACECERDARAYDKRIKRAEDVMLATIESLAIYANSHGFIGHFPYTRHELSCVLIAKDANEMQRDYYYTVSPDPTKLESTGYVAKQAAKRTLDRLGAKGLRTVKAPVIFAADMARGLLGHFASAINGGNIYRKASFLLDHLNQAVFPAFIQLQEQPHLDLGLGTAPFDTEGVRTRPNQFIRDGILQSYSLNTYSARKLGLKTTGNAGGLHNLTINPGEKDLNALIKTMHKGLVITELMGQGINIVTGNYSRGAAGFWVENGEIQYPVHEITVAGNLKDIFAHIVEVGNDVDLRGNIRTGSLLIEEMMIAGQ